ncbi:hypothetical protein [Mycobacterium sp. TY815]|nr:hypothetical protein [Mycobacterium sp. TY815]MDP7704295.1 hypothetical protein [Mycobacterium sp. TY815]
MVSNDFVLSSATLDTKPMCTPRIMVPEPLVDGAIGLKRSGQQTDSA